MKTYRSRVSWFELGRAVLSLVIVGTVSVQADSIYDSLGFEAPGLETGTIWDQDGWGRVASNNTESYARIQENVIYQGVQALEIYSDGTSEGARRTVSASESLWLDMWILPPPVTSISANFSFNIRNSSNQILAQIGFNSSGRIANQSASYVYNTDEWNRVTVFVDVVNDTYSLYLNGQMHEGGSDIALQNNRGEEDLRLDFTWRSNDSASGYVDNFQITTTNPIPEPGTIALAAGLLGIILAVFLRRSAR